MKNACPEIPYLPGEDPVFLAEASKAKLLLRLQDVGMHCGLQYTSFPYFQEFAPYSRYEHSLGVARMVYAFTHDEKQTLAGLYHDIATPTFSHVIDFLKGDALTQEATEEPTSALLREDKQIRDFLAKEGIQVGEVEDVKLYPICDSPAPRLCADRVEYTLDNFLRFHLLSFQEVTSLYLDMKIGMVDGRPEIVFESLDKAKTFGMTSLINSDLYSRKEDRYAMDFLSEVLKKAIERGDLKEKDFRLEEKELIAKLKQCGSAADWQAFVGLYSVEEKQAGPKIDALYTKVIPTKKRFMDPFVLGKGRLSQLDEEYAAKLKAFCSQRFDESLTGYSRAASQSSFAKNNL